MIKESLKGIKVLVRGAGDIASGIIWNLAYAGFCLCCTEVENPSTIRTEVAFSSAVYDGSKKLEGVECIFCNRPYGLGFATTEIYKCFEENKVALIIDPELKILNEIKFDVVVDAILAKKNLGTNIDMAKLVIGVGPGFTAKKDCHVAIETMRGHNLARIIEDGSPMENTGVPGIIEGCGKDRVIHSEATGIIHNKHKIGDVVKKGEVIAEIETGSASVRPYENDESVCPYEVRASIDGILRGIIRDGYFVEKGLKIADIDPRFGEYENCFTISDKARSIGGAVVVAVMRRINNL